MISRAILTPLLWAGIFFSSQSASAHSSSVSRYWVIFRDKGASASDQMAALAELRREWPERSLARRRKAGSDLSTDDLPLAERDIRRVEETGARVVCQSRWLSAVSVEALPGVVERLRSLPLAREVRPVAAMELDAALSVGGWEEITMPAEPVAGMPLGAYGPSFRQVELAGVIPVHQRGVSGDGVLIGMLDTGFQLDHRALAGLHLIAEYDFIFGDDDPSWDPRTDRQGQASHGTACLSVIGGYDPGRLVGIAPRASFALGKTEDTSSETPVEEDYWIEAIEWLEMLGADVVSSSLTYRDWYGARDMDGEAPPISRAAQRAVELGMIVCISAGNAGPRPITIGAPADAPGVLAVAAVDSSGRITNFSSRGPSADGRVKPDLAAMGRGVVCVSPLTFDRYARWNGTSLACPIVAGVAALVIEAHPDWPPAKVILALRAGADRAFIPDDTYGYGLVDCREAVDYPSLTAIVTVLSGALPTDVVVRLATGGRATRSRPLVSGRARFPNLPEGRCEVTLEVAGRAIGSARSILLPPSGSVVLSIP